MKKLFTLFLLTLLPLMASADAVEIDGIYYNLVKKMKVAEVATNPNKYSGNVIIPETITFEDEVYTVTSIGDGSFYECTDLTSVAIPNSVTSIGKSAFSTCSKLSSIVIPNSVTSIGDYAFWKCTGLTSIKLPDYLVILGWAVFCDCTGLTSVILNNGLEVIGDSAFYNCNLENVEIPVTVTTIGESAFACSELSSISLPSQVRTIKEKAFRWCENLSAISLPNGLANISDNLFEGCSKLSSITIPDGVISIGSSSFADCTDLTSIMFSNSVIYISGNAFARCCSLESVVIPNSINSIGERAFYGCDNLVSLTIGNSVDWIMNAAFANCPNLEDVYCYSVNVFGKTNNDHDNTASDAFEGSYIEYVTLHVPESAINDFKSESPWSGFGTFASLTDDEIFYDLTVTSTDGHGSVTCGETEISGGSRTFNTKSSSEIVLTLTPDAGYQIGSVTINGEDASAQVENNTLTINGISANTTVSVSFSPVGSALSVTLTTSMGTLCSTEDLDFTGVSGLEAYIGSGFNRSTGSLLLTRVYDVPAGTGLVLKGTAGSTYEIPYSTSSSVYANLLRGVTSATTISTTDNGYTNYILVNGTNGTGFYIVSGTGELAAGKAYLSIPSPSAASRQLIGIEFADGTTGISGIEDDNRSDFYSISGQRIKGTPAKTGIYIKDGRKVIIK